LAAFLAAVAEPPSSVPVPEWPEARIFTGDAGARESVPGGDEAAARRHLARNGALYGVPEAPGDLRLEKVDESLLGRHFHFRQYSGGIPVLHAGVSVSMSHSNGAVYLVHCATVPADAAGRSGRALLDSEGALDRAWEHVSVRGRLNALPGCELVWVPVRGGLRLAYAAGIACSSPLGAWDVIVDAETGQVLESANRMRTDSRKRRAAREPAPGGTAWTRPAVLRAAATAEFLSAGKAAVPSAPALLDSGPQGAALVFDPDPRTALADDSLSNTSAPAVFASALVQRPLRGITFESGLYRLTGPWVTISDFDLPSTPPSTTADGQWSFPRGNNGLNDAMVYLHIDQSQRYLQALGYTGARGVQSRSIQADSDGVDGDDNSYFDPAGNRVSFGHGGVADPEDADVILHEYGHAIEYAIEPDFWRGDTGAIGEGFGDYWAGSYGLSCSNGATFHPDWVFHWDGHNEYWSGRVLDSKALYTPGATYDAHQYVNGVLGDELWSAPLFQSLKRLLDLGRARAEADAVVIESHFGMGYGTRIPAMASNVVATALALYPEGPHAGVFFSEFTNRNILTRWQLAAPAVVFPPAGECLLTGSVRHVRWSPPAAPVRAGGEVQFREVGARRAYWTDNVEGGTGGWTVSYTGGTKNWARVTTTNHSPSTSWWADEQLAKARMYLVSPGLAVSNDAILSFWHKINVQTGYDGGVVEVSTNNGTSWADVTTNVTSEGYSTLYLLKTTSDNPIKGRKAFSGSTGGFVQSFINMTRYAGKTVKIRFCMATDSTLRAAAPRGWWIDDVSLLQDAWEAAGAAGPGECCVEWAPARAMTAAVVRVKCAAAGCVDSAWATGSVFSVSADTDGDRLPDVWEIARFGALGVSSGSGDFDGDGSSDYTEWIAGTSPADAASVFKATDIVAEGAGAISLGWTSATGRSFAVEWTGDLAAQPFAVAASNLTASPPTNRWAGPVAPGPRGALRIRVDP
jgi:hypothetical protein